MISIRWVRSFVASYSMNECSKHRHLTLWLFQWATDRAKNSRHHLLTQPLICTPKIFYNSLFFAGLALSPFECPAPLSVHTLYGANSLIFECFKYREVWNYGSLPRATKSYNIVCKSTRQNRINTETTNLFVQVKCDPSLE